MSNSWIHRKADSDEERFGLLDKPTSVKYKKQPVFQEPVAEPKKSKLVAFGFTSGVGSMLYGAQELGFQIVGNVEHRDYYRYRADPKAKSTFPENFPGAFMSRGIRDTPKDLLPQKIDFLAGHPECLPGVTNIYTSEGWRPIKDVQEGDLVLTHQGKFKPVVRKIRNILEPKSKFVEIRTSSSVATDTKLNLTANHPVLTQRGWVLAEEVVVGDLVSILQHECVNCGDPPGKFRFAWTEVKVVRTYETKKKQTVFNLSVLDDHSYVAKGFAVHNCGRFSQLSHSVVEGSGAYKATRAEDVSDIPLFVRTVAELRPRFFLMDDLPDSFGPFPMQKYIDLLPDYDLFPEWISNFYYGNIQKHRNRMFMVGALKSEKFTFVPGEAEHKSVLRDLIGDLIESAGDGTVPNHAIVDLGYAPTRYVNMRFYGERITWAELSEVFKEEHWARNLKYYTPEGVEKNRPGTINPRWDGHCPVLSGGYNPLHPVRRLPLTVRERARIQGFPDSFVFYSDEQGPYRKVWEPYNSDGQRGIKQTGKAMPLQFCKYVADQVKHHIEKKPFETTKARLLKPNPKVSKAKLDFCEAGGYADQDSACNNCWLKDSCHLRSNLTGKESHGTPENL